MSMRKACRKQGEIKERRPRNEMRPRVDASRNVQGGEEMFANVSTGADTKRTLGVAAHLRLVI